MKFERNELTKAIHHIDEHPEVKRGRESSTYDLIFEDRRYPPILVLSVASQLRGGQEERSNSIRNGNNG